MKTDVAAGGASELDRLRAHVMADPALQADLGNIDEPARFIEEMEKSAARLGIAPGVVRSATQTDPLGLVRWAPVAPAGPAWPPAPWLPVGIATYQDIQVVDWSYFGPEPLREPFFEGDIRRVMRRSFNRLFRYRMTLANFLADAPRHHRDALTPSGFIFHMSRCGSTLAARMLAALPQSIIVSEAAPIDAIVQLDRIAPTMTAGQHAQALAAMVAAYGRRRAGNERHYAIKLDAWHTLALPVFRRAFPDVPWVFLYRDPVEVLVSQMDQPGTQMIPDIVHPGLYGIDPSEAFPDLDYCARVLAKICTAALDHAAGGIAVNYRELPDAVFTKIVPHFGIAVSEAEREAIRLAAREDAKAPSFTFIADSDMKQREATELIRTLAAQHLGDVYRRLEAWRG